MNIQKNILIFTLGCILVLLSSCKIGRIVSNLKGMNNTEVKAEKYTYGDKSIIFVPITHFGEKIFYSSLRDSIINWKTNDYTIFYEQIIYPLEDSSKLLEAKLKWRKIKGGKGNSRKDYDSLTEFFKNKIVQPEYEKLGIDSTDINADVTRIELVNKYEEIYGEIIIDSCDRSTSFDSTYNCTERTKNDFDPIIMDFRNEQLVERIINTEINKIVVVYGARHHKGIKKLLKHSR